MVAVRPISERRFSANKKKKPLLSFFGKWPESKEKLDAIKRELETERNAFKTRNVSLIDPMQCPMCDHGILRKGKHSELMSGVVLGEFPVERCTACGESFTDSVTTQKIEEAAKKKGIWGLGAITKITKTGNSLAVRIPKKIADHLHLRDGEEAYLHPESGKLVVEAR